MNDDIQEFVNELRATLADIELVALLYAFTWPEHGVFLGRGSQN